MSSTDYARIEKSILYLGKNFRRQPVLKEAARIVGLSEYHFHRLFTRWAGISPKRFLQYLTAEYAGALLRESPNVLEAAWEAGLSGSGRRHDLLVNVYAMTPGEMKGEAAGVTIRYGVHPSPFGDCLVAVTDRGICGLSFLSPGGSREAVERLGNRCASARPVPRERWDRPSPATPWVSSSPATGSSGKRGISESTVGGRRGKKRSWPGKPPITAIRRRG